ncbi:KipI family sensor histidine kinase inhibitor [Actinomadura pelletieri DSM 43383]|uniref:KipI family sensor histidine kinase inhibitor n=1 Tax=Actinomadura pelletieri DSM 43383 TaxID=1120940 RepID=A0A495QAI4_9ACTN|nr:5-oxoprolinase subunit PxpB [Actinomadura pelletieri]RKS68675.1 KipI family sensor histidine kinase inhibitor [Actinomadura pelletieri DSM 43383]
MRVLRAGDTALLVETGDLATAHRLNAALRDEPIPGIVDVVVGEQTVLVVLDPSADLDRLAARLPRLPLPESAEGDTEPVEIPVVYDGEDLDEVAADTGLSREEVVHRHSAASYTVAYLGFSPGFGYLTGLDPRLHVARRASPRTSVPAGSVAIAGPYAAVYPSRSPGGWRLLGRTDLRLWDVTRDPPSLLRPGMRVRFVPEGSL